MTETPNQNESGSQRPRPGEDSFREELLRDMSGGEPMSLSDIDSRIQYDYAAESLAERQSRVIHAAASLLTESLAVVGQIVGGTDAYVDPWKLSTEEALARIRENYVGNYDDRGQWAWTTWFALTPAGERAAEELSS